MRLDPKEQWKARARAWAFVAVPLLGVVELTAHVAQTHSAPSDADWMAARDAVRGAIAREDLLLFSPRWSDPLGRRYFGVELATFAREGRADDTRFARAFEISIHGQTSPEVASWPKVDEKRFGGVTVITRKNPAPTTVIDDLLSHDGASGMHVVRVDPSGHESDCAFAQGAAQAGNLGFGPAVPGNRWSCPNGAFVGISIVADLDYWPRRCFYAPPPGGNSATRIVFKNVAFGSVLHGHHALYVEAERKKEGAPVTLRFRVGDRSIGTVTHNDGDGWKAFELPTAEWAGQSADLVAEVSAPNGNRRMYCFEADTR